MKTEKEKTVRRR